MNPAASRRWNPAAAVRNITQKPQKTAKTAKTLPKTTKSRRKELPTTTCGNGKTVETSKEKLKTQLQCGKAPAEKTGGQRRKFPAVPQPGSLVRIIKERCNASLHCDVLNEAGNIKIDMDVLCDTGTQAGCCGAEFVRDNDLDLDEDCTTKLVDASGNEMTVIGSTKVRMRPSVVVSDERADGGTTSYSNENGEAFEYELVVTEELGNEVYLGRDDCVRMGVINKKFPSVKSSHNHRRVRKLEATVENSKAAQLAEKVAKLKKEYSDIFGEITKDRACTIGGPAVIHLNESDEGPFRARTARRPPRALQEKADKLMDKLEKCGVVSRVYWPTHWCSRGCLLSSLTATRSDWSPTTRS